MSGAATPGGCDGSWSFCSVAAAILALPALMLGGGIGAAVAAVLSAVAALAGTLVERWLFFAEAEHVSSLYYGSARV